MMTNAGVAVVEVTQSKHQNTSSTTAADGQTAENNLECGGKGKGQETGQMLTYAGL
jgi:hypothetical protein